MAAPSPSPSSSSSAAGAGPLVVVVSGAAGQIGYSLLPLLANGRTFGPDRAVELRLLEIAPALKALEGVRMELQDGAYPLLASITCTADPTVAMKEADVVVLVGGFPRRKGMLRKDLIAKNTGIFKTMGTAIEAAAKATCKVLVVANPANTNCLVALQQCRRVPAKNFSALTRLDCNRARAQVASKVGRGVAGVRNVIIWGNHSATQYPDVETDGKFVESGGEDVALRDVVGDDEWLRGDFIAKVQQRGKAVIEARGLSSAMSAANAVSDHLRTWLYEGTRPGEHVPMAVYNSAGHYGVAPGTVFSFPCVCENGDYRVKDGFHLSDFAKEKLKITEAELLEEKLAATAALGDLESKI